MKEVPVWRKDNPAAWYWTPLRGYVYALLAITGAAALHLLLLRTVGAPAALVFFVYLLSVLFGAWWGYGPGLF